MTTSVFTIQEITGEKRLLGLMGRALPYRPFSLDTEQRVELTWLPGVTEATATVLGPKEEETTINGFWKDKYLGDNSTGSDFTFNGAPITTVRDARDVIDELCRSGVLLEVQWLDEKRWGLLKKFAKQWHNEHDLEWSITFAWISRGEQNGPPLFVAEVDMTDAVTAFSEANSGLRGVSLPKLNLNLGFVNGLSDIANSINDSILNIEDSVINVGQQVTQASNAVKGIIATCSGIADEAKLMRDYVCQTSSSAISSTPKEDMTAEERIEAEQWRSDMLAATRKMLSVAVQMREAFIKRIQGDLAGRYIARDGEDLRDVSQAFYKTPFEWRRIMIFNELESAELTAGQIVLVPRVNAPTSYGAND